MLATLIQTYPGIHLTRRGDPFTTLARAIVGQQISVKAAQTIWDRVLAACRADGSGRLDPATLRRKRLATLRTCGLSERKALYIRDLAKHFASARLDPATWSLDVDAVAAAMRPNTRMIVVNSPHSPTGSQLHRAQLERLVSIA